MYMQSSRSAVKTPHVVKACSAVVAAMALMSCGSSSDETATVPTETASASPVEAAKPFPYPVEGCKAAMATVMGREPNIMTGKRIDGGLVQVSYRRPDDNKLWTSQCRYTAPDQLTWRTVGAFKAGELGRWRDEDTIILSMANDTVVVTFRENGEHIASNNYPLSQLR